ncbi:hypothetical protein TNCV_4574821 [Trichonephila clavipes]|nr:hypothetical protein TNCV_4574821 [Trichonephila clavipes]
MTKFCSQQSGTMSDVSQREKRHYWSSPSWSIRVQNSQPCGRFKDHCVKSYNSLHKPGYSKKDSFFVECYEETIVPRAPELDTTAMGRSHLNFFPGERTVFQDNALVHTSHCIQTWLHEPDEVKHLSRYPQSPDLNLIECLRGLLENKICVRFPPSRMLSELEEWG